MTVPALIRSNPDAPAGSPGMEINLKVTPAFLSGFLRLLLLTPELAGAGAMGRCHGIHRAAPIPYRVRDWQRLPGMRITIAGGGATACYGAMTR